MGQVIPRGKSGKNERANREFNKMWQIAAIVKGREIAQCQGDNIIPLCERVVGGGETASPLLKTFSTRLVLHVLALFSVEALRRRKIVFLKVQKLHLNIFLYNYVINIKSFIIRHEQRIQIC